MMTHIELTDDQKLAIDRFWEDWDGVCSCCRGEFLERKAEILIEPGAFASKKFAGKMRVVKLCAHCTETIQAQLRVLKEMAKAKSAGSN